MFKIAVMISGRGSNFKAIIAAIKKNNWPIQIAVVLSDHSTAGGLEYAKAENIPIAIVERKAKTISKEKFNSELATEIQKYNPDLVVLAGFMRVLTTEFIGAFRNKIVNIHPSLLPSFRGLDAQKQSFEAGVKFAGCTVHYVTEELDGGPIISQAIVPVLEDDTVEKLSARILIQEHQIYPTTINAIAEGKVKLENDKITIPKELELSDEQKNLINSINK
jgi:phosphoribosylglycinamide formyltransferase-1